jgi:hypothetical protein
MQYLEVDFVICITKHPLAFERGDNIVYNYFSGPSRIDERFMFISTQLLDDFTRKANCSFEKGIAYIMLSQLVVYFSDIGYHQETRGCLMDFCRVRSDMVKGLTEMRLCDVCSSGIKNAGLKKTITAILSDNMVI